MNWHYEPALKKPVETESYTVKIDGKHVSSFLLPPEVLEKAKAVIEGLHSTLTSFGAVLLGDSESGSSGFMIDEFAFFWDPWSSVIFEKTYVQYRGHNVGRLTLINEVLDD